MYAISSNLAYIRSCQRTTHWQITNLVSSLDPFLLCVSPLLSDRSTSAEFYLHLGYDVVLSRCLCTLLSFFMRRARTYESSFFSSRLRKALATNSLLWRWRNATFCSWYDYSRAYPCRVGSVLLASFIVTLCDVRFSTAAGALWGKCRHIKEKRRHSQNSTSRKCIWKVPRNDQLASIRHGWVKRAEKQRVRDEHGEISRPCLLLMEMIAPITMIIVMMAMILMIIVRKREKSSLWFGILLGKHCWERLYTSAIWRGSGVTNECTDGRT